MRRPGLRGVPQAEGTAPLSGDGWQHRLWNCNRAGESLPAAQSRLTHLLSFHTELIPIIPKQTHFRTFRAAAKTSLLLLLLENINKVSRMIRVVHKKARFDSLKQKKTTQKANKLFLSDAFTVAPSAKKETNTCCAVKCVTHKCHTV